MIVKDMRKAIAFIEYVSLILAISIALLAVQFYLKRAVSSNWKETGDVFGHGRQYEPPAN
ncbi:MAG: hypothetical protein KAJ14_13940 [Candidatus Omnitrophica bacterium]|nr:hypothetical protein [Candidatus Omnitrophota bacterium]